MSSYRNLTDKEIATMVVYGCTAENWKNVQVAENFKPDFISNVHFSGDIRLGTFEKIFELHTAEINGQKDPRRRKEREGASAP